jgi:hypothetical protein
MHETKGKVHTDDIVSFLFVFVKKSLRAERKNRLDIVTSRIFVVHLLHNKMVKDQLLFAGLHDSLCKNTAIQVR